jgi:hypothetical protein
MRKIVSKRIRHSRGGVNIAADIDAVIAVNTGDDAAASRTVVRSSHTVVQSSGRARREPDANDPTKENHDRRQEPQAPDA